MAIDINGINVSKFNERAQAAEKRERSQAAERAESQDRNEVELSSEANVLRDQVRSAEAFDQERVAAITRAIEQGEYPVNAARVAEKFLELESQLY